MPELTTINHVGITVTDLERSVSWYTDVFGFTKLMEAPHPDGTGFYVVLGKPDWSMNVGLHIHPDNAHEPFSETRTGLDHISLQVPDRAHLETWEAHLARLDVSRSPINDQPGYSVLVFRDPDNIQLELISMG
jgi:catechol 2,3-dioxygenase-like lactoylglutathione lyase family enzyme